MDPQRFLECQALDYARLRDVAAKDLDAAVPSCPGWTVTDLVRHVALVYLHKVEAMRQQKLPAPWPPAGSDTAEPIPLLERAWGELSAEFAARPAEGPAFTWFDTDQTVGFWIRRMAHETLIHRIDAELALADEVRPVPDDLAVDGVDEVLGLFLEYGSKQWPDEFRPDLPAVRADPPVRVLAGGAEWLVHAGPNGVDVERGDAGAAAATVRGEPAAMLCWLWGRGNDGVTAEGDQALVARLRRLLVLATQ